MAARQLTLGSDHWPKLSGFPTLGKSDDSFKICHPVQPLNFVQYEPKGQYLNFIYNKNKHTMWFRLHDHGTEEASPFSPSFCDRGSAFPPLFFFSYFSRKENHFKCGNSLIFITN